jgi:hypothetical protein
MRAADRRREAGAQLADTGAHLVQLGPPVGAQILVLEHGADHRRAMIGRHRPHGAGQAEQIAERDLGARALDAFTNKVPVRSR